MSIKIRKWQDLIGKEFVDKNERQDGPRIIIQLFMHVEQYGKDKGTVSWEVITFTPQHGVSWMRMFGPEESFVENFLDGHEITGESQYTMKKINRGPMRCYKHGIKIETVGNYVKDLRPCPECKKETTAFRRWHNGLGKKK